MTGIIDASAPTNMNPTEYPTAASFLSGTSKDLSLWLEMPSEELRLARGHWIDLMAKRLPDLLLLCVQQVDSGRYATAVAEGCYVLFTAHQQAAARRMHRDDV